jgi:hypothetical protein
VRRAARASRGARVAAGADAFLSGRIAHSRDVFFARRRRRRRRGLWQRADALSARAAGDSPSVIRRRAAASDGNVKRED